MSDPQTAGTANWPSGTVTFLVTDIEASSKLWELDAARMRIAVTTHDEQISRIIADHDGIAFKKMGDGIFAAFHTAPEAIRCATQIRQRLEGAAAELRIRIALHTTDVAPSDGDYLGPGLNRLARLIGTAEGDQTLVSAAATELGRSGVPVGWDLRYIGDRRLRDIEEPMGVYELAPSEDTAVSPPSATQAHGSVRVVGQWPAAGRTFIGRTRELAEIEQDLASGARLVTITGSGGIGKTRLSCEVASRHRSVFVDCSAFAHRDEVAFAVLQGLDAAYMGGEPEETVLRVLAEQRCLLILDCFERIVAHSEFVDRILDAASEVSIIVTSRVLLGLVREREHQLGPMSSGTARSVGEQEQLFSHFAESVAPGCAAGHANRSKVTELCNLLEGSPLMMGLAAARLRYSGLDELLEHVRTSRLELEDRRRGVAERHIGPRKVIGDSIDLLEPTERALLGDICVFDGGFFVNDAIEVVLAVKGPSLREGLIRLRENSLLMTSELAGRKRFVVLDSVREFVGEPSTEVRLRHARHFAASALQHGSLIAEGRWTEGKENLVRDIANFRAAAVMANRLGEHAVVADIATGLARSFLESGLWADYDLVTAFAHQAAAHSADHGLESMLLGLDGALLARKRRRTEASEVWRRRAAYCKLHGDTQGFVDAILDLAEAAMLTGDTDSAISLARDGLDEARRHGLTCLEATALALQSELARSQGEFDSAIALAREAVAAGATCDDLDLLLYVGKAAGATLVACGAPAEGLAAVRQMIRTAFEGHRLYQVANGLVVLATSLAGLDRKGEAADAAELALEIMESLGSVRTSEVKGFSRGLRAASGEPRKHEPDRAIALLGILEASP